MKKYLIILIGILLFIPNIIFASSKFNIYLFHGETCPHCIKLNTFLDEYLEDKDNIVLNKYEVWNNEENKELFENIKNIMNIKEKGVPCLIIGDKVIIGYSESYNEEIINTINYYLNTPYEDKIEKYINSDIKEDNNIEEVTINNENNIINKSNISNKIKNILNNSSSIIDTILLGLISSFNISSVFIILLVLSFISLFNEKKTKRIISLIFILSLFIINIIYTSNIIDNTYMLNKTSYIRIILSLIFLLYGALKLIRYINDKKKINVIFNLIVISIGFILLNILFIYTNISIPSLYIGITNNNILLNFIYSFFSILLYSLIIYLYLLISNLKWYKNNNKYFIIISCILIALFGIIIVYKPLLFI